MSRILFFSMRTKTYKCDNCFCLCLSYSLSFSLSLSPLHSLCSPVGQGIQVLVPVKVFTPAPNIRDTIRYRETFLSKTYKHEAVRHETATDKCVFLSSPLLLRWQDTPGLTLSPQCPAPCTLHSQRWWTHTMLTHTPATMSMHTRMHSTFLSLMGMKWHCGAQE